MQLQEIQIAAIEISEMNARKNLSAGSEDAGLAELAESIRVNGLINPPTVRPRGNGNFEVIAGQRRVLACQKLGMPTIQAFVSDWDDDRSLRASLVENLQRADMDPMDKAYGLDKLSKRLGSDTAAAKSTGLTIQTVRKYLSLLRLPEELTNQIGTGSGPTGVGAMAALAKAFGDDAEDAKLAWELVEGFSGKTAEQLLRESKGDMERLAEYRELALEGKFDVQRCGSDLMSCPWLNELSPDVRVRVERALQSQ